MRRRVGLWLLLSLTALLLAFIAALCIGRYPLKLSECIRVLLGREPADSRLYAVVMQVRLPRALLAALAGAGLSVAGAAFQSMFSNPLATPDTLGAATGASLGATLGILLRLNGAGIQALAFVFGVLAIGLVCRLSQIRGQSSAMMLVLSGIVIGALCEAMVSLMKYTADPQDVLPQITFWLMGSFSGVGLRAVLLGSIPILLGIAVLLALRWRFNALSLSEDEARALGLKVQRLRAVIILFSALITASVVSLAGKVGWVGLLAPHGARMLFGNDNRLVLPSSAILGALFLLCIDTIARSVSASELPLSVLTAAIGAPVFIVLLRKTGGIQE